MSARAQVAAAFGSGLLFGFGLVLSGMTQPPKVQGFLDLAGAWDPSLAFVMGGAVAVAAVGFAVARRREVALLGAPMPTLPRRGVTLAMLAGSAVFGVGWGLGGYCPGPAVVSAGAGSSQALVFCAAMLVGAAIFESISGGTLRGAGERATLASIVPSARSAE